MPSFCLSVSPLCQVELVCSSVTRVLIPVFLWLLFLVFCVESHYFNYLHLYSPPVSSPIIIVSVFLCLCCVICMLLCVLLAQLSLYVLDVWISRLGALLSFGFCEFPGPRSINAHLKFTLKIYSSRQDSCIWIRKALTLYMKKWDNLVIPHWKTSGWYFILSH